MNRPAPGWLPDPDARHEYRYWDGSGWTADVADGGVTSTDPVSRGVPAPPPPSPGGDPGGEPTTQIDPTEEFPVAPAPPTTPYPGAGATGVGPDSGQYAPYPAPTPARKRPSTALIAGLVVLVIALVGGGIWLLVRDDGDDSADDASEVSGDTGDASDDGAGDDTASDDTTGDDTTGDDGAGDDTPGDEPGSLPEDVDPGNEGAIVDAIASALEDIAGGEITHDQAVCVSEGFIDEFGLSEIASGTNPFSAEAQAEMTEIFERCDVDPESLSGSFGG